MTPKEVVEIWIDRFNQTDVDGLADLYAPDAINDQVVFSEPLQGRPAIRRLFELEFSRAKMVCNQEKIYECGDTAICKRPMMEVSLAHRSGLAKDLPSWDACILHLRPNHVRWWMPSIEQRFRRAEHVRVRPACGRDTESITTQRSFLIPTVTP